MDGSLVPWVTVVSIGAISIAVVLLLKVKLDQGRRVAALAAAVERQQAALQSTQAAVRSLEQELAAAGRREAELVARVAELCSRQEQLSARGPDGSYLGAIRDARAGASPESLMSAYGLTRGEADLVVTLHRPAGRG